MSWLCSRNYGSLSKGHRSQPERALTGQFWDKLMLIVMNYNSFDKIIIYEFMSRRTISCRTIPTIKCGKNDRCRELPLGGTIIVLIGSWADAEWGSGYLHSFRVCPKNYLLTTNVKIATLQLEKPETNATLIKWIKWTSPMMEQTNNLCLLIWCTEDTISFLWHFCPQMQKLNLIMRKY